MAEDGADVVIAHLGVTTKASIGAILTTILEQAPAKVQGLCNAAKSVNPDVIALCHGGPVYMHDDAQGVNRFYGTSSVERLQSEIAIREQMKSSRPFGFRCQGLKSSLLGPPRGGIR